MRVVIAARTHHGLEVTVMEPWGRAGERERDHGGGDRAAQPDQTRAEGHGVGEHGSRIASQLAMGAAKTKRDPRPVIYYTLDQLFAIGYVYVVAAVIPNRLASASIHLWSIPVCMQVLALGTLTARFPGLRRTGWWVAIAGGSLLLLSTILLIARILASAAFLAGVYGAFGQGAAMFALVAVALVIELVALLPVVQIRYLMSRAGRRAFA